MCRCSSAHGGESETTSFAIHPACQKGAISAKWRARSGIVDGEAHQGCPAHHFLQNFESRIGHVRVLPAGQVSDRKSTRLHSSHVSISYAVFCLKKKINSR